MIRALLFALALLLLMTGLLAGGCSALFTPDILRGGDYVEAVWMVWAMGLGLAVVCIGLGVLILRRLRPAPPEAP